MLTAASEPLCPSLAQQRGRERQAGPRQAPPGTARGPQRYLGQEVLAAADSVVESLGQQRLHVLGDEACSRVELATLLRWGRPALSRRGPLHRVTVGALGSLYDLRAGTLVARPQAGVSQADGFSSLLSAA